MAVPGWTLAAPTRIAVAAPGWFTTAQTQTREPVPGWFTPDTIAGPGLPHPLPFMAGKGSGTRLPFTLTGTSGVLR